MEVHRKFTPIHGWRQFFGEVGIIVLGVLIALGAEQAAEQIHWHEQVKAGRETLSRDLAVLRYNADERIAFKPCLDRRLTELGIILDRAAEVGRLPALKNIGYAPRRTWLPPSWDSLSAGQVASHFPREQLLNYSQIAYVGRLIDSLNDQENSAWTDLSIMEGPGRRLSDTEAVQLRLALARAKSGTEIVSLTAAQFKQVLDASGLPLDADQERQSDRDLAALRRHLQSSERCRSLLPGRSAPSASR
jgi:hypothetical protein